MKEEPPRKSLRKLELTLSVALLVLVWMAGVALWVELAMTAKRVHIEMDPLGWAVYGIVAAAVALIPIQLWRYFQKPKRVP